MMKFIIRIVLILMLGFSCYSSFAQKEKTKGEVIKMEHAEVGEGIVDSVAIWKGNVHFSQDNVHLYCDSAYQYTKSNSIEAFGHVRMTQGDTVTLNSDRLNYNGNTKLAYATGNVVLKDRNMTLYTDILNYDIQNKLVLYTTGGKINDTENKLNSRMGSYSTASKIFHFKKDVHLVNTVNNYILDSDTLEYNSITKMVTFLGPTVITSPSGKLNADKGDYNTMTGVMNVNGRSRVAYGTTILEAKSIRYDKINSVGIAHGEVRISSTKDSIIIDGDEARYSGASGLSKIWGNAVMKNFGDKDTLFLTGDTLLSIETKDKKSKKLYAYHHVKIFRSDLQGICDSLLYDFIDSTIQFVGDPVLWNNGNQIEADSMTMLMSKNKISRMYMVMNSFIISEDSIKNYNQVKGRNMTAHFKDNKIETVYVDGNGESIYFALEETKESKKVTGMNKVVCSNMIIRFVANKLVTISFIKKPDGKFMPPHEVSEPDKRLKGFSWRISERPSKKEVTHAE